MLRLKNITKTYTVGDSAVQALDGVSIDFRPHEFVSILGPAGCGKTTMLNIIGGLDQYTSGDLVISGRSTKEFRDSDWDTYRNHSVGFVFQSYNLIPHQSILSNVELALTIGGKSGSDQQQKAIDALTRVGLGEQIHKKPNQLSGGQMQRVAIARALVNDPDIILADEPTGALDSKTSVQIMDILKEVAKEKLVIMVTHNPDLAEQYADRIIQLKDGQITSDSRPFHQSGIQVQKSKPEHTRLGIGKAIMLSLNNLFTKKGRTFLTSFAGSVGIIGIALILALSNGVNTYIKSMESDMLGNYPIQLQRESFDLNGMMSTRRQQAPAMQAMESEGTSTPADGKIHSDTVITDSLQESQDFIKQNDLKSFKKYLDKHNADLKGAVSSIEYGYDIEPQVFRTDPKKGLIKVYPATIKLGDSSSSNDGSFGTPPTEVNANTMGSRMLGSNSLQTNWKQMASSKTLLNQQYKLLSGQWPKKYNEVALVIDEHNKVPDYMLYTLGLMDISEMDQIMGKAKNGKKIAEKSSTFNYSDAIGKKFRCFAPATLYTSSDGVYVDRSSDENYMGSRLNDGSELTVTAVLRLQDDSMSTAGVVYTPALTQYLMKQTADAPVVKAQLSNPGRNVLTGKGFDKKSGSVLGASNYLSGLLSMGTSVGAGETPTVSQGLYRPSMKDAFSPVAYAGDAGSKTQSALFQYVRNLLQQAIMSAFQNIFTQDQVRAMVQDYINKLSPEEKQQLIAQYTQNLSKEDIQRIAAEYSGSMSDADVKKMIQQYMGNMTEAEKQQLIKQYAGSLSRSDMEKLAAQYMGNLTQDDIRRMIGKYADGLTDAQMSSLIQQYLASHRDELINQLKNNLDPGQIEALMAGISGETPSTYDEVLQKLGYATPDDPSSISIYPSDFENKDKVIDFIKHYNSQVNDPKKQISFTDLIATITNNITDVVETVSSVLIAFVAISLIVSSIMIAIITYISVLERTKEIGILRALGSSKGDISKIFNAETFIEGLISGFMGIILTLLISIPINHYGMKHYAIAKVAILPPRYALLLILISVILTLLSGFIPSRIAAKKDPVAALRSE